MNKNGLKKQLSFILVLAAVIAVFAFIGLRCKASEEKKNQSPSQKTDIAKHRPKLLLYSFIHPDYLRDTAEFWGKKTGFSGFMISYLCDWHVPTEKILKRSPRLKLMNEECKKYGIDSNFIKLSLGHLKKLDWTDEEEWKKIVERVRLTARVARDNGFVGIALDTEPYYWRINSIWDYKNSLYKGKSRDEMEELVGKRGNELMLAIKEEFPESEFIIFPEGYFYYKYPKESINDTAKIYNLWGAFFRGLCNANLKSGIVVGTERTYHIGRPSSIKKKYRAIYDTMAKCPDDSDYWKNKCSLAPGAAPLGKSFKNKSKRYSYKKFENQMGLFVELSPRYAWIYGHGAAWWKLNDQDKYKGSGFSYWRPYYQVLDCDPDIQKYYMETYKMFKGHKEPERDATKIPEPSKSSKEKSPTHDESPIDISPTPDEAPVEISPEPDKSPENDDPVIVPSPDINS